MTDKRFEMIITDIDGNFYYLDKVANEKIKSTLTLENKLNELNDENEKLKNKLKFFMELNKPYGDIIKENEQLKKELKRCKDWINSDKNDYELTLAFIKNKGYSLKDVLEYEKKRK